MEENIAAADLVLTEAELAGLNGLITEIPVQGARYADDAEARTNL